MFQACKTILYFPMNSILFQFGSFHENCPLLYCSCSLGASSFCMHDFDSIFIWTRSADILRVRLLTCHNRIVLAMRPERRHALRCHRAINSWMCTRCHPRAILHFSYPATIPTGCFCFRDFFSLSRNWRQNNIYPLLLPFTQNMRYDNLNSR